MLMRPFVKVARDALVAIGVVAAVGSVLAGAGASSPGDDNPYSPEYGRLLHEWAIPFAVASLAFVTATLSRVACFDCSLSRCCY